MSGQLPLRMANTDEEEDKDKDSSPPVTDASKQEEEDAPLAAWARNVAGTLLHLLRACIMNARNRAHCTWPTPWLSPFFPSSCARGQVTGWVTQGTRAHTHTHTLLPFSRGGAQVTGVQAQEEAEEAAKKKKEESAAKIQRNLRRWRKHKESEAAAAKEVH
eukprot:970175-Rhodomonas_salina.1